MEVQARQIKPKRKNETALTLSEILCRHISRQQRFPRKPEIGD
jgi:hypothetical protein